MIFLKFLYIYIFYCLLVFSFYLYSHKLDANPPSRIIELENDVKILREKLDKINHKAEYGYFFKHDQEMLQRHARNNTIWIISTNKEMLPIAYNLLCSIAHFDPSLIDYIVFHAVDVEAKIALERHRWHDEWRFDAKNGTIPTFGKKWGYGVLYNPLFSGSSVRPSWSDPAYEKMMRQKPSFFLTILRTMGLNLLFSDADILYYYDPLKFVMSDYLTGSADLSLSTDARNMFDSIGSDWERYTSKTTKIPSFCGGLFFARSNNRTILFFEKLELFLEEAYDMNVQTGFEQVLEEKTKLQLVGRLPRGLTTKPGINSDKLYSNRDIIPAINRTSENEDILTVHILDQWQFINGIVYERHQAKWEEDRTKLTGDEVQVMKHANFPKENGQNLKLEKMKKYGWLLLDDDNETCLPLRPTITQSSEETL
eukprot:TRINITY_DN1864_c0_g1_i3.p1 TRINITY_DN1864_c0_g1~~TRINITY_DN1864_c0_g1_i3.p1  ORF type:complete len:425 (-),score=77.40 TRINITY_DN1864_c0_g1_i3:97-1371(-)